MPKETATKTLDHPPIGGKFWHDMRLGHLWPDDILPRGLVPNNWGLSDIWTQIDTSLVELIEKMSPRHINALIRTHGLPVAYTSLGNFLKLPDSFLSELSQVCPADKPPLIIGSRARRLLKEETSRQDGINRSSEFYNEMLNLKPFCSDTDISLPDLPQVINVVMRHFPGSVRQPSRSSLQLDIIRTPVTQKPVEFHIFNSQAHPLVRHLFSSFEYTDAICIALLHEKAYLLDFFYTLTHEPHRFDILFPDHHLTNPDARLFNFCLKKIMRLPYPSILDNDHRQNTVGKLTQIVSTFDSHPFSFAEAESVCHAFRKECQTPDANRLDDQYVLLNLGRTGILPKIIEAAFLTQDPSVIDYLFHFLHRAIEYSEPPVKGDPTKLKADFLSLYPGAFSLITTNEVAQTCLRLSQTPPDWFSQIHVDHRPTINNPDWNMPQLISDIDDAACIRNNDLILTRRSRSLINSPFPGDFTYLYPNLPSLASIKASQLVSVL